MIEFFLPRTFLTVSTTTGMVIVWYCWRWIRWQEQRTAANAQAEQASENE